MGPPKTVRTKPQPRIGKVKVVDKQWERSICVKLLKKVEKCVIEEALTTAHSGIEKICFPRQTIPRFFFVRCTSPDIKAEVWDVIKELKNDKMGPLLPKVVLPPKPKIDKSGTTTTKKTIDPSTLVLEMIPKEISTEKIRQEFQDCKKASRFNDRRCYLYFTSLESAFAAYEKLTTEPVLGHKISARFRKVMKITKRGKKMEKLPEQDAEEMLENSDSNNSSDDDEISSLSEAD